MAGVTVFHSQQSLKSCEVEPEHWAPLWRGMGLLHERVFVPAAVQPLQPLQPPATSQFAVVEPEQSVPSKPAAHEHRPYAQTPRPLQCFMPSHVATEQSSPAQPSSHAHCPPTHRPCCKQPPTHSRVVQCNPAWRESRSEQPLGTPTHARESGADGWGGQSTHPACRTDACAVRASSARGRTQRIAPAFFTLCTFPTTFASTRRALAHAVHTAVACGRKRVADGERLKGRFGVCVEQSCGASCPCTQPARRCDQNTHKLARSQMACYILVAVQV